MSKKEDSHNNGLEKTYIHINNECDLKNILDVLTKHHLKINMIINLNNIKDKTSPNNGTIIQLNIPYDKVNSILKNSDILKENINNILISSKIK